MEEYEHLQTEIDDLNKLLSSYLIFSAVETVFLMAFVATLVQNFESQYLPMYVIGAAVHVLPWIFCAHFDFTVKTVVS